MLTQSTRQRLLASSFLIGAAALAMSANGAAAQGTTQSPSTTPSGSSPQTNSIDPSQANSPAGTFGSNVAAGAPANAVGPGGAAVTEVTVTGSRIRQPNLTSTSPLTVVNAQELKLQGTANVENLLNNLPAVTAGQTEGVSNGSTGTATVNLRNLGSARTLVLVDGRRFPPSSSTAGVVDINNIPAALVDRVDVVTGGASAVYGADAVAGVVNFILKKDFQGLRIDAQYGFANHQNNNDEAKSFLNNTPYLTGSIPKAGDIGADGFTYQVTAILGANSPDGKGNVTAYAAYRNVAPVLQSTRDFSQCTLGTASDASGALTQHLCTGSSNNAFGRFDNTGTRNAITGRGTTAAINNPNGTKSFVPNSGAFVYNFGPTNYFQREDDQYRAGYFAHYKVAEWLDVYSDFMFMDDDTNAQIAPSGFFASQGPSLSTAFTFNCNNPLIGAAQLAALCPGIAVTPGAAGGGTVTTSIRYRFATVPRNTNFRHDDYKVDVGARGDFGAGWHYDAYLQYGTSNLSQQIQNYASLRKLQNALNVVNNAAGVPVCVSGSADGCAPLDIFAAQGANFSPKALKYVLVNALTLAQSTEQIAHADISGDLGQYGIKSPFADNGLGVAFGAEYRSEFLSRNFDEEQHTADLSGGGGQALDVKGNFDVYELFAETRLPLVENKPFIKDLSVDAGYRFSDYSTAAGTTDTYKFEANYSPTADARVRFSYNRAVRAPNIVELFTPQVAGLGGYQDPCSGALGSQTLTFTAAQCALTGLPTALYGTGAVQPCASAQCEILSGGNPNLQPEVADTYSLGLVFTPRFLRNFTATVDYFNIDVQNVIATGAGPSTILKFCAAGQANYCALIKRDPQGTINSSQGYVFQTSVNSGALSTRGFDFTANYRFNFSDMSFTSFIPGSIQVGYLGTYTQDLYFTPVPKQGRYNCVGLFGPTCGNPQPAYKHQMRFSWVTPFNATFSVNWRYIGNSNLDYNDTNPFLQGFATVANGGSGLDLADAKTGTYNYFDLAATYRFRDRYNIRVGVNNVFDKDPPLFDSNVYSISSPSDFGNGNTFPGIYDVLGRTIFVGITADF